MRSEPQQVLHFCGDMFCNDAVAASERMQRLKRNPAGGIDEKNGRVVDCVVIVNKRFEFNSECAAERAETRLR